jgi:hypothetical protein
MPARVVVFVTDTGFVTSVWHGDESCKREEGRKTKRWSQSQRASPSERVSLDRVSLFPSERERERRGGRERETENTHTHTHTHTHALDTYIQTQAPVLVMHKLVLHPTDRSSLQMRRD